jgi:hypothetical protein
MPTLLIDNVPMSLYQRLRHLAEARKQTPEDTVLEVLESELRAPTATPAEAPLPQEPFLTEEICAPCSIPCPVGERGIPTEVVDYVPLLHDWPDEE